MKLDMMIITTADMNNLSKEGLCRISCLVFRFLMTSGNNDLKKQFLLKLLFRRGNMNSIVFNCKTLYIQWEKTGKFKIC